MSVGRAGGWVAKCFRVGSHNPLWKIKFYLIFNLSEKYFCLKSSTGASSSKLLDLESQFTALMDERAREANFQSLSVFRSNSISSFGIAGEERGKGRRRRGGPPRYVICFDKEIEEGEGIKGSAERERLIRF